MARRARGVLPYARTAKKGSRGVARRLLAAAAALLIVLHLRGTFYECPAEPRLVLTCRPRWYGRLGNNLISLLSAAVYARTHGLALHLSRCRHDVLDLGTLRQEPFRDRLWRTTTLRRCASLEVMSTQDAFFKYTVPTPGGFTWAFPNATACWRRGILAPLLARLPPAPRADVSRAVVVHIRSGDVWGKRPSPFYAPPPLSYYVDVLERHADGEVLLVTELEDPDNLSPVVQELRRLYPARATVVGGSLLDDAALLYHARCVVASQGTFAYALALAAPALRELYLFENRVQANQPVLHDVAVVEYSAPGYIGNWTKAPEQVDMVMAYPRGMLQRRAAGVSCVGE